MFKISDCIMIKILLLFVAMPLVWGQAQNLNSEMRCPQYWVQFQLSCYRFIKSPLRNRNDARKNCEVSIYPTSPDFTKIGIKTMKLAYKH